MNEPRIDTTSPQLGDQRPVLDDKDPGSEEMIDNLKRQKSEPGEKLTSDPDADPGLLPEQFPVS